MAETGLSAQSIGRMSRNAATRRDMWFGLLREAIDLTFPNRSAIQQAERGQKMATANWDGTAPLAVIKYAERMMEFTPPGGDFIVLEPGPFAELLADGAQVSTLKAELRATAALCNAVVQTGGFFTAAHEMYLDHALGIGGMIIQEADALDPSAIARFVAQPIGTFYVEDGPDGRVERRWRWFDLPADRIKIMWRDATIPEPIALRLASTDAAGRDKITAALVELEYFDWDQKDGKEPWVYRVVCQAGRQWHDVVTRRSATSQWLTPRHSKRAGESMGRGPIITALPDIRTANKVTELTFRAIALNLLGIWMATEGQVNPHNIRLQPAAVIPVRSAGGANGPSLARLDTGNFRPDFASIVLEEVRTNIKRTLMDAMLPPMEGPVRSATEVAARLRELALDQPGAYGRIIDEMITPLVQRLIDILHRRGFIRSKIVVDQLTIKVSVSSPLAREQRMAEVERIVQWLEMLKAIGGTELLMIGAHLDKVPEKIADLMGIDQELVADEKQREKSQANMAQVMGAQMGGGDGPVPTQQPGAVPLAA